MGDGRCGRLSPGAGPQPFPSNWNPRHAMKADDSMEPPPPPPPSTVCRAGLGWSWLCSWSWAPARAQGSGALGGCEHRLQGQQLSLLLGTRSLYDSSGSTNSVFQ